MSMKRGTLATEAKLFQPQPLSENESDYPCSLQFYQLHKYPGLCCAAIVKIRLAFHLVYESPGFGFQTVQPPASSLAATPFASTQPQEIPKLASNSRECCRLLRPYMLFLNLVSGVAKHQPPKTWNFYCASRQSSQYLDCQEAKQGSRRSL